MIMLCYITDDTLCYKTNDMLFYITDDVMLYNTCLLCYITRYVVYNT